MSVSYRFFARTFMLAILLIAPGLSFAQIVLCTKVGGGNGTQDIPGDVTITGFENCISLGTVSEGAGRSITQTGGGPSLSNPSFSEIAISKDFDAASVNLRKAAIEGTAHGEWVIHFLRTCNQNQIESQQMRLRSVYVASFSSAGSESDIPSESITLNFGEIQYTQNIFDENCAVTGNVQFGWDLTTNSTP